MILAADPNQPHRSMIVTVACTQPGCDAELRVLAPTWRCRDHRPEETSR